MATDDTIEMVESVEGTFISANPYHHGPIKLLTDPTEAMKLRAFIDPPEVDPADYEGYKLNKFGRVTGGKPGKIWLVYFEKFHETHCQRCNSFSGERGPCGRSDTQDCRGYERFEYAVRHADWMAEHDLKDALFLQECFRSVMATMTHGFAKGLAKRWREESLLVKFAAAKERTIPWEQAETAVKVSL